jgi:hypothetical protein
MDNKIWEDDYAKEAKAIRDIASPFIQNHYGKCEDFCPACESCERWAALERLTCEPGGISERDGTTEQLALARDEIARLTAEVAALRAERAEAIAMLEDDDECTLIEAVKELLSEHEQRSEFLQKAEAERDKAKAENAALRECVHSASGVLVALEKTGKMQRNAGLARFMFLESKRKAGIE